MSRSPVHEGPDVPPFAAHKSVSNLPPTTLRCATCGKLMRDVGECSSHTPGAFLPRPHANCTHNLWNRPSSMRSKESLAAHAHRDAPRTDTCGNAPGTLATTPVHARRRRVRRSSAMPFAGHRPHGRLPAVLLLCYHVGTIANWNPERSPTRSYCACIFSLREQELHSQSRISRHLGRKNARHGCHSARTGLSTTGQHIRDTPWPLMRTRAPYDGIGIIYATPFRWPTPPTCPRPRASTACLERSKTLLRALMHLGEHTW